MFKKLCLTLASLTCTAAFAAAGEIDLAAQRELTAVFVAQAVAYQPQKAADFPQFAKAVGLDLSSKQGMELKKLAQGVKAWPTLKQSGNTITVMDGAFTHTLEIVDISTGAIKFNGMTMQINPNSSYVSQFKAAVEDSSKMRRTSFSFFIPTAVAADSSTKTAGYTIGGATVAGGAIGGIGVMIKRAIAYKPGLKETGKIVGRPAATLGIGAGVVGCMGIQGWMKGSGFWNRYTNCITAPATLVGANPRDHLYLRKIEECTPTKVTVRLESTTGRKETRTFDFSGDQVKNVSTTAYEGQVATKVDLTPSEGGITFDKGTSKGSSLAPVPLTDAQLHEARGLLADATYYQGVCRDPARKKEVLAQMANNGGWGERTQFDSSSPQDIDEEALEAR